MSPSCQDGSGRRPFTRALHSGRVVAMHRPTRVARLAAALAVLVLPLLAGACGGDDDTGSESAGAATTPTAVAESVGGELDLLSYNVAGLPEVLSGSEPATNMPLIAPLLNEYDLVLLQETWKTPDPNPLASLRVYHEELESRVDFEHQSPSAVLPLGEDPTSPEAILADGLNQFSRFPFDDVLRERWDGCFGGADTSRGGAGDCLAQKGFMVTRTTLADGVEVDVYNLHAEAGGTPDDQVLQAADYEQLAAFIEEHSAGHAVLLAGDTNLHTWTTPEPDNPEGEGDLDIWQGFLDRTGLTDVCEAIECEDPSAIDKAAFRSDGGVAFEPIAHDNPTDTFVRDDGEPLSDHPPLEVTIRWSASGG